MLLDIDLSRKKGHLKKSMIGSHLTLLMEARALFIVEQEAKTKLFNLETIFQT